jgi:hypothetical protein
MNTPTPNERAERAETTLWEYRPMLSNFSQQSWYRQEVEQTLADLVCDAAHLLAKLGEAEPVARLATRLETALETHYEKEVRGND